MADPRGSGRLVRRALTAIALLASLAQPAATQELATATLQGTVYVGDAAMPGGTVVLHHLSEDTQGELDSMAIAPDGTFSFQLRGVPDPERGDVYFASVRHDGVLYFGPAITTAVQLDSLYAVHAYDTLLAPVEGAPLALQSRSIFFEPDSVGWRVTDLFQIRNDEPRTIVARSGGRVWSHPMPNGVRDVSTGEGELALDAASYEDGELVVRAALSPGERIFVVRYWVDSPILSIPNGQPVEAMDVLLREPAPAVTVEGLELLDRIELEAGSTYLRFTAADVTAPSVRIVETEDSGPPPVEWAAVLLALVLGAAGLLVLRSGVPTASPAASAPTREALLTEIARLDEQFESGTPDAAERRVYERRRADLLRQVRGAH